MSASANAKLGSIVSPSFTTYSRNRSVPALPQITHPKRPEFRAVTQHCLFTTTNELGFRKAPREDTGLGITGGFTSQFASMYRDTSLSSLKHLLARAELSRTCEEKRQHQRKQRADERERKKQRERQRRMEKRQQRRREKRRRSKLKPAFPTSTKS